MIKPFHLSFTFPNLEAAKNFYISLLGCKIGRDTGNWIDVIFFGHQITIHQEQEGLTSVPIGHFGTVLGKRDWVAISKMISSSNVPFELNPIIKDEGTDTESGKFIIKDPASNVLEFKYYKSFNTTVAANNA
ncbi:MAG: dioxygenase [Gammaproteobacteria bacterium]|nr:MAG: dioxygenase [Gammaproteobacteria bacterium]